MDEIKIVIPGVPLAKKTHRDVVKVNWGSQQVFRHHYFPQSKEAKEISEIISSQYEGPLLDEGIFLAFEFYMPVPKRWPKRLKEGALCGRIHHLNTPDVTNLAKFYEDCLKNTVLTDDSKIIWISPIKVYDEKPRTEIYIRKFDNETYNSFQQIIRRRTVPDT